MSRFVNTEDVYSIYENKFIEKVNQMVSEALDEAKELQTHSDKTGIEILLTYDDIAKQL